MEGSQKPKQLAKKPPQRSFKERRAASGRRSPGAARSAPELAPWRAPPSPSQTSTADCSTTPPAEALL